MRHGDGPEVEYARVFHQRHVHLPGGQFHVRAGIAVEGKITVAMFVNLDEGQGGVDFPGRDQPRIVNAFLLKRAPEHFPEHVMPHLADEGGPAPQPGQHGEDIAGGSPRIGLVNGQFLGAHSAGGEVHQQFSEGYDVIHAFPNVEGGPSGIKESRER